MYYGTAIPCFFFFFLSKKESHGTSVGPILHTNALLLKTRLTNMKPVKWYLYCPYTYDKTHTHTKSREQKGYFPRLTGIHGVLSNLVLLPAQKFSQSTVEEKYPG